MPGPSYTTKNTTAEGLRRAEQIYSGDWDAEPVTSVYLPNDVAHTLLEARGWRNGDGPRRPGPWISPSGYREWDIDLALRLALTAETFDLTSTEDQADEHPLRRVVGVTRGFRGEVARTKVAGANVILIDTASEHGGWLDGSGGRWVLVCDAHDTTSAYAQREEAEREMKTADWCEGCQRALERHAKVDAFALRQRVKDNHNREGTVIALLHDDGMVTVNWDARGIHSERVMWVRPMFDAKGAPVFATEVPMSIDARTDRTRPPRWH